MERVETLMILRGGDIKTTRAALELPQSDFGLRLDNGLLAEMDGVQRALFAGRLLAIATMYDMRQQKLEQAVDGISQLIHLANGLSNESHIVPRVAGARVREDAFLALQTLCTAPGLQEKQLKRLHRDIAAMIAQWPDDALVWRGERAQGLHAFEMVRADDLLSLLGEDELDVARNRGLNEFTENILDQVDEDEQFYMSAMQQVIAACDMPYHARADAIDKIMVDVEELDGNTKSAWLSANMLLTNVSDGLYWQGHDRALAEAWLIALNAASGDMPTEKINPLTGRPFIIEVGELHVTLWGISDENGGGWATIEPLVEPLVVPRLAEVAIRSRRLR